MATQAARVSPAKLPMPVSTGGGSGISRNSMG